MRRVLQSRRGMGFTAVFCLSPPSFLLPGAFAPHPLLFLAFVWSCGGVGFLSGCLPVFPLVFHGGCGRVW